MATIAEILEFRDELQAKFGANTNVAYSNVSTTQLSIARHYGGAKVMGHYYLYNPDDDSLIREDVAKWIAERRKSAEHSKKPEVL